jgi:hypothetical protein
MTWPHRRDLIKPRHLDPARLPGNLTPAADNGQAPRMTISWTLSYTSSPPYTPHTPQPSSAKMRPTVPKLINILVPVKRSIDYAV